MMSKAVKIGSFTTEHCFGQGSVSALSGGTVHFVVVEPSFWEAQTSRNTIIIVIAPFSYIWDLGLFAIRGWICTDFVPRTEVDTLGNYMLKTAADYKVPESQRVNAEKKRRQMFLLEESVHAIKIEFTQKILALREYKEEVKRAVRGLRIWIMAGKELTTTVVLGY